MAQVVAVLAIALPALALVLWPLVRPRAGTAAAAGGDAGADPRLELAEERDTIYRALKELAFDHETGLIEDDDYQELRARYEGRAAEVLRALDALGPLLPAPAVERRPAHAETARAARGPARSPVMLGVGALVVLIFGLVLGLNIGRFAEPDRTASAPGMGGAMPMPGPLLPDAGGNAPGGVPGAAPDPGKPPSPGSPSGAGSGKAIPPEMLAGMLRAARQSLADGRYQEAIAAYQAVLKRDTTNVDAMTHLGLIVAIGGHADAALETWDKALKLDPDYAPAYLYRGELLYEVKRDYSAAIASWQRFLTLVPTGQDHDRVQDLIRQARSKPPAR